MSGTFFNDGRLGFPGESSPLQAVGNKPFVPDDPDNETEVIVTPLLSDTVVPTHADNLPQSEEQS